MLFHGQQIGQDLGRVEFIGQAIEDRHTRKLHQCLHIALLVATELDPVIKPAQHPGGISHRFLVAHLAAFTEIGHLCPLVEGGHLEGAAGAGRGFLED